MSVGLATARATFPRFSLGAALRAILDAWLGLASGG